MIPKNILMSTFESIWSGTADLNKIDGEYTDTKTKDLFDAHSKCYEHLAYYVTKICPALDAYREIYIKSEIPPSIVDVAQMRALNSSAIDIVNMILGEKSE